jgi:pre-mRNA-splicing helicase BRR2
VDYNLVDRRAQHEPTGEVMPLNPDVLRGTRMGDRYARTTAPKDKPVKKSAKAENAKKFRPMLDTSDFTGEYKPRTQETKTTFEVILSFIQEAIGDQARDILIGSAEEVLKVLKTETIREADKRGEVEDLLGKLKEERYHLLVNLAKKITDFELADNDAQDVSYFKSKTNLYF